MNPNQPKKDDVFLGSQETRVPLDVKWRLANGSEEQRLAALTEVLEYEEGYDLLIQQALKDNSEKVQQSAYWVLHGHNPYLTELSEKRSPDNSVVPTDTVSCVAISADNQTLAGGSWKIVRLWRFGSGELLRTLEAHSHWVLSVAISPDGNTLVSGGADKTIKLWNLKTGQVLHTLTSHTGWVNVVAITPDGQTLISGSTDKTIKLWELNTGKLLRILEGHSGSVCSLAVSPDGQLLASGSADKTIKLWDLSNGKLLHTLADHSDWVHAVAFTSDSNALVSGSRDGSIKIWQSNLHSESQPVASQELPISFTQLIITIILVILAKFTAGISLAVPIFMLTKAHNNSKKKAVIPFESEVFKCVNTITEHSSSINSLAISPDGKILAIGSDDNTIKLWSPEQEKSLTSHSGFISSVAISPDGKTLASGSKDWVMLWNLKTGELLHSLQGNSRPKLSRIVVLPSQVRLEFGQSQIFNVRGLDQNGYEINIEQVTWQATGGNIETNGLFLAGQSEGNFTVTATVGMLTSSASVTAVEPLRLTRLVITPQQVSLESGQKKTFIARGLDQHGNQINIEQVSWYATGGEISTHGTFQAGQNSGNFDVLATVGEISGYASVTIVEPPRVASLVISPSQLQLEFGQTQHFSVRGLDQYGNGISIGQVTWSATGGTIEGDRTFRASYEEGNITVTATVGEIRCYAFVTVVEPPKLTTLVVSPQQVQLKPDERQRFTVRGLDQHGREIAIPFGIAPLHARVAWKATGGHIQPDGTFIAGDKKGNFTVTASIQNLINSASITVIEPPKLKSVVLSPPQVDKKFEQRQQFTVRDLDQCDSKSEIGKVVCDASNGEINTEIDNSALAFPVFAVLSRLEISPKDVKIEPDERLTFSIKGLDQYGHEIEIRKVNWTCSTGGRIDRKGLFIGGYNKRQVTVTATVGEVTHSTQVTLLPVLKRLEISPKGVTLEPGESQIFKIIGFDQYGKQIEPGKIFWEATGGEIDQNGTFTADYHAKGKFLITATYTKRHQIGAVAKALNFNLYFKLISYVISTLKFVKLVQGTFTDEEAENTVEVTDVGTEIPKFDLTLQLEQWILKTCIKLAFRLLAFIGKLYLYKLAGNISASVEVRVIPVLRRLEIFPKEVQIEPEQSITFTARGFDQHGDEIEIRKVAWSATGGKINSNGTFIASSETGYFTVAAIVGAFKSVASVTIAAQESLDDHYDDISTDFDGEEDTNLGGSTCDYLNDEYSNSDDDQNTDVSNEGDTNDSGEEDTDDGGKGGDTAPQPRSHTKRKTFVADRDQILQLAVELLDVCPNRYRLVINVVHRARQIFYQNHTTTEKTAVLRAIKEMAEELSQPEIIGD